MKALIDVINGAEFKEKIEEAIDSSEMIDYVFNGEDEIKVTDGVDIEEATDKIIALFMEAIKESGK
jgi:hypothetical protein